MRDHLTVGFSPYDEPCAQMGSDDYYEKVHGELDRYIKLLKEKFGPLPIGVSIRKKSFNHEAGTYYEACVFFDDDDNVGRSFAIHVEHNLPATWKDTEKVPFEEPEREAYPAYDMEELEDEARRILGD